MIDGTSVLCFGYGNPNMSGSLTHIVTIAIVSPTQVISIEIFSICIYIYCTSAPIHDVQYEMFTTSLVAAVHKVKGH